MSQDFIFATNGSVPQTTLIESLFTAQTTNGPFGAIRGTKQLAATVQPVTQNAFGSTSLYSPDVTAGDSISMQLGLIDTSPTAGTFNMGVLAGTISSVGTSGSYTVTTASNNLLATANTIAIYGSQTTPSIDGYYPITVLSSDTFNCTGIPAVSASAAGGAIYLVIGTASGSNLELMPYNQPAATMQTALNLALTQLSLPLCDVTQPEDVTGVYEIIAQANGAVASNLFWIDATYLFPASQWAAPNNQLGNAQSVYIFQLIIEVAPFCYSPFPTALPSSTAVLTTTQVGSSTANQTQQITFSQPSTYGGTYTLSATCPTVLQAISIIINSSNTTIQTEFPHGLSSGNSVAISNYNGSYQSGNPITGTWTITVVDAYTFTIPQTSATTLTGTSAVIFCASVNVTATCGILYPGMSAGQITAVLTQHPSIFFSGSPTIPNNIIVQVNSTQLWSVQFTGTLGNSSVPTLNLVSSSVIGPTGFSGVMNINTTQLYSYSRTQSGSSFSTCYLSISRTRTTGEQDTIWGPVQYTVYKDNLNLGTATSVILPSALNVNPSTGAITGPVTASQFASANDLATVDGSGNVLVGTHMRFVPSGTGGSLQTSPDGVTWTTQASWP